MKLIVAIIRPEKLDSVQDVLKPGEARLLSIGSVENGAQGRAGMYRGAEVRFRRPAVRLEIAAEDWCAETAVTQIVRAVSAVDSEQDCEDTVFMMPLDACVPSVNRQRGTPPSRDLMGRFYSRPLHLGKIGLVPEANHL